MAGHTAPEGRASPPSTVKDRRGTSCPGGVAHREAPLNFNSTAHRELRPIGNRQWRGLLSRTPSRWRGRMQWDIRSLTTQSYTRTSQMAARENAKLRNRRQIEFVDLAL